MQSTKSLFVLIPTIVLSLASCRTPQQTAVQAQQYLQESVRGHEQQIHRLQQQISLLQIQTTRQQTAANRRIQTRDDDLSEIIIDEFDTTQPVDTTTGTPPLKSRRTEKREHKVQSLAAEREDTQTAQYTAQTAGVQQTAVDSVAKDSRIDHEKETQTDAQQHTGLTWWQTTLCTLGATALLILLVWIALKILKRYFKPF